MLLKPIGIRVTMFKLDAFSTDLVLLIEIKNRTYFSLEEYHIYAYFKLYFLWFKTNSYSYMANHILEKWTNNFQLLDTKSKRKPARIIPRHLI